MSQSESLPLRYQTLGCLTLLVTATCTLAIANSQSGFQARAEASYKRGKMIAVSKMSDPAAISACSRSVLIGTVVSPDYNDRSEMVSFVMASRNGRQKIRLAKSLYDHLPIEAETALPRLVANGRRLRVVMFTCAGSTPEADEVRAL